MTKKLTPLHVIPMILFIGCGGVDEPQTKSDPPGGVDRFERIDMAPLVNPSFVPRSVGSTMETFVVKLSGDPVALVQAARGVKLRLSEKAIERDRVAFEQAVAEPQILALGGQVVARYRDAYNGLKVRVATSQLQALRSIPGVVGVHRLEIFRPRNIHGVPLVGAPAVWAPFAGVDGFHGDGVKIAIIDSGIDYTHLDFGGPGTPEAYQAAFAASALPADPALFGPDAPKVKGGIDLAGDAYDPGDPENAIPQPDSNPLDCLGHGSHVAGTAAGFGVLADGTLFRGPYDAETFTANSFLVGPGVAPAADLYAVRVFGCNGASDLVVDAIEWAVANDMDVINMSLGSEFGTPDTPSAEASDNAVQAGIVVVAAAGNSSAVQYIIDSPGSSSSAISVAAQDPTASFAGVALAAASAPPIQTINANEAPLTQPALEVKVLTDADGNVLLGCDPAQYQDVAGKLVVTKRGSCARVARAIFGEQAGAAAVLMINTANALPPSEGQITSNPDTGEVFTVTIPFLGASLADEAALKALAGQSLSLTPGTVANPAFETITDFSSEGPRALDSHLKPDVIAPGLSIRSAGIGSGNGAATISGTSMATPHVTGLAALVRQAHPNWSPAVIKTAIVNTNNPAAVVAYQISRAGSGLVSAPGAVRTNAFAWADASEVHLNLGLLEPRADFVRTRTIRVRNTGTTPVSFDLTTELPQGSAHEVLLQPSSITVPANNTLTINVTISIGAATAGDVTAFNEAAGLVLFTPTSGTNNGVSLRVPYYAVLRPQASVTAAALPRLSPTLTHSSMRLTNAASPIAATADFYAWGLSDGDEGLGFADIRAVGAQSFPSDEGQFIVFALNTQRAWSSPSMLETDIAIDTNGDGTPDFLVLGIDLGQLTDGSFQGQIASAVVNLATGEFDDTAFLAVAPTSGSTLLLPIIASQIGLSPENPRLAYSVQTLDLFGGDTDATDGSAIFNAFTSSVSQGDFIALAPDQIALVPITLDPAEQALSPSLGHMIVAVDNRGGAPEARLVPLR